MTSWLCVLCGAPVSQAGCLIVISTPEYAQGPRCTDQGACARRAAGR